MSSSTWGVDLNFITYHQPPYVVPTHSAAHFLPHFKYNFTDCLKITEYPCEWRFQPSCDPRFIFVLGQHEIIYDSLTFRKYKRLKFTTLCGHRIMFSDYLKVTDNFAWSDMTLKHKIYSVHHCLNMHHWSHIKFFFHRKESIYLPKTRCGQFGSWWYHYLEIRTTVRTLWIQLASVFQIVYVNLEDVKVFMDPPWLQSLTLHVLCVCRSGGTHRMLQSSTYLSDKTMTVSLRGREIHRTVCDRQ